MKSAESSDKKNSDPVIPFKFDIEPIDSQHQKLFRIFQRILDNIEQKSGNTEQIIEELEEYTHYHFSTEEDLMKKFDYQEINEHIVQHEIFIQKMLDFKTSQLFQSITLNEEIAGFLRKWFLNHILEYDAKYVGTFKKNLNSENEEK